MSKPNITYYKLISNFENDITKNCGLTSTEIDENFYFLRGNDIETAFFNPDNNTIVLNRVNGDKVVIDNISTTISSEGTYYDVNEGVLHLFLNGVETLINGFTIPKEEKKIYAGNGIKGNGEKTNPFSLNYTMKSSYFPKAKKLIDTTKGEVLPSNPTKGDSFLTKENFSKHGLLYNFNGVLEIAKLIENTEWRVPSNEEWGQMLNALEFCEKRNHISNIVGIYGEYAGACLKKDGEDWKSGSDFVSKSYGFKAMPSGRPINAEKNPYFGDRTRFWTTDETQTNEVWTREIVDDAHTVELRNGNKNDYYSLRLVRDYNGSVADYEDINGLSYETVLMPYLVLDENNEVIEEGKKVWTAINIYHNLNDNNSITVKNANGDIVQNEPKFFLNIWDGVSWDKREFTEGDIILLTEFNNEKYQEVQLLNGELNKARNEVDLSNYYSKQEVDEKINILSNEVESLKLALSHIMGVNVDKLNNVDLLPYAITSVIPGEGNEISVTQNTNSIVVDFNMNGLGGITNIE